MRTFIVWVMLLVAVPILSAEAPSAKPKEYTIGPAAPSDAPAQAVSMTAKKYQYDPAEVVVEPGTALTINLTALDRSHGFQVQGFDTCVDVDPKNGPATIHFFADKPGDYPFKCCHFCGWSHGKMKGVIKVQKK